ncbi:MAG TPA: TlpA disulfide reductase family protein [Steroidobacteraceae bacterium]
MKSNVVTGPARAGALGAVCAFLCMLVSAPGSAAPLDLSALRGRVIYLDFWASWCAPCRQSFPWMESMRKTFEAQGLTVIAVNVDRDRADADRFLQQFRPGFDVRFDPRGLWAEQFKVAGMPTSVIIDRQGALRFRHIGFWPADSAVSARQIRELLDER